MSAEHEVYMALFREGLRRAMAEEDANDIHNWLTEQLLKLGGASDGDGVLWWQDTFDFYDALLARREAEARHRGRFYPVIDHGRQRRALGTDDAPRSACAGQV